MSTTLWIAGHNLSGYMPESSPYLTASWESARDSIAEDIQRHADSLYDGLKTHKYFEEGREEWSAQQVLDYFNEHPEGIMIYAEHGQWKETLVLTDNDKEILTEIAQCEKMLKELSELEPNTEWDGYNRHTHNWLHITERDIHEIPEGLEGDELEEVIDRINEMAF